MNFTLSLAGLDTSTAREEVKSNERGVKRQLQPPAQTPVTLSCPALPAILTCPGGVSAGQTLRCASRIQSCLYGPACPIMLLTRPSVVWHVCFCPPPIGVFIPASGPSVQTPYDSPIRKNSATEGRVARMALSYDLTPSYYCTKGCMESEREELCG